MSSAQYPRDLAIRVLTRVMTDGFPLDEALNHVLENRPGSLARPWLQEVCAGTLRWRGRLDLAIDSVALKKRPTGWLRKALLLGAYQLIGQNRTSPAAVVSETVNEVRRQEGEAPARFANALLRKIAEHAASYREMALPTDPEQGPAWASLPPWIWYRLLRQRGKPWAMDYAQASLSRPMLWVRARQSSWAEGQGLRAGPIPGAYQIAVTPSGELVETGSGAVSVLPTLIDQWPGFASGEFFVQDISSQLLLAEISAKVRAGCGGINPRALDLCAAPGGKAAGLAWNGFQVVATDRDGGGARMGLLQDTVARVAPSVEVIDRSKVDALTGLDLVWVDAPCTGSGILRRHPEVRWLRQESELNGLFALQRELAQEAWQKVRPGGYMAYSVCSVLAEEGPGALADSGLSSAIAQTWSLDPQSAPHGDGFWAALLKK